MAAILSPILAVDRPILTWRELPSLPLGLAGQYVGIIDDHLVVAGGSYWTASQWEGGKKTWSDAIYLLRRSDTQWRLAGKLPEPLGYGAATGIPGKMFLLGGQTPSEVSPRVYRLQLNGGQVDVKRLADLPQPIMMAGSAVLRDRIYLAGGQPTFTPSRALHTFLALPIGDLETATPGWEELPPWPGPATFFPQMTSAGNSIYLIGGADLVPVSGKPPVRSFLKDAYGYSTESGWRIIAAFPHPVQAGLAANSNETPLVFGGSDGLLAPFEAVVKDDHPGFSTMVWAWNRKANQWIPCGRMPVSLVTTGIVRWGDEWIIVGGEDRPGHRSPRVIAAKLHTKQ